MEITTYFKTLLILILTCFAFSSFGQQRPELQNKKNQNLFYRRSLQVDSAKAAEVVKIQDEYKAALKAIVADSAQSMPVKRERIKVLIEGKNQKLKLLLTPAQQEKMIPTTERIPSKAKPRQ